MGLQKVIGESKALSSGARMDCFLERFEAAVQA